MSLLDKEISSTPKSVIYIPNFISEHEEKEILEKVYAVPKPKWTQLKNRRLQNWGGFPHIKGMIPEKIPDWLCRYIERIDKLEIFESNKPPNHVLVNEYEAGQGIMPHFDGPLFHPVVTTISCGSSTILNFYSNPSDGSTLENYNLNEKAYSLLLEPRSLLILRNDMYTSYMHGIDEVTEDTVHENIHNLNYCARKYELGEKLHRSTRISLTVRRVPKCSNFKLRF